MRYAITAALVLACVVALIQPSETADAALSGYFTISADSTHSAGAAFGFLSVEAVSGAVGLKVHGFKFEADDDSLVIQSGDILNLDLYTAGTQAVAFSVYPASGATARGYYW